MNTIVYEIEYLTICFILDLQENIYTYLPQTYYMSPGEAGRHVVGFLCFFIDIFLEVQNKRYSQTLYLIDYVVPGLHF